MLDAFVIEEIRRRERERDDRPSIQIPLPQPPDPAPDAPKDDGSGGDRGVVIIDYGTSAR
jgi:hypothetical protein